MLPASQPVRVLTGITTTGTLHLGNYVGAMRPAIAASRDASVRSYYFMADYHGLIKCDEPERIARSTLQIAATWMAAGLDTERAVFYRQSDIPQIPELTWLLTCVTAKGQMNRAHAYKAMLDANVAAGEEPDAGVSMGLYCYPILMAADILMFSAQRVPVGKDQVQHIEMARDVAQRFNHQYGGGAALLTLPEAQVDAEMELLPGLDGRKMSKSYDNVVPLFDGGARALREAVARIVTDSRLPGEPKEPEGTVLVALWDAFATPAQRAAFRAELRGGLGWGAAKEQLLALLEAELAPMRARYDALMAAPEQIEAVLQAGAARARAEAAPLLARLRQAVGLRRFEALPAAGAAKPAAAKTALPVFKQYREPDGRFAFKLNAADGQLLLQGSGSTDARAVGACVAALKATPEPSLTQALADGQAALGDGVDERAVRAALGALHDAAQAARGQTRLT